MTGTVRLDASTLAEYVARLDAIERAAIDLRPAWAVLRRRYRSRAEDQWQRLRPRWRPLSASYAAKVGRSYATLDTSIGRPPKGLGHPPGQLRRAVTKPDVYEADPQSLVMGVRFGKGRTPAFYGAFHAGGNGVPRRPFWRQLAAAERDRWMDDVFDHLTEPLR